MKKLLFLAVAFFFFVGSAVAAADQIEDNAVLNIIVSWGQPLGDNGTTVTQAWVTWSSYPIVGKLEVAVNGIWQEGQPFLLEKIWHGGALTSKAKEPYISGFRLTVPGWGTVETTHDRNVCSRGPTFISGSRETSVVNTTDGRLSHDEVGKGDDLSVRTIISRGEIYSLPAEGGVLKKGTKECSSFKIIR